MQREEFILDDKDWLKLTNFTKLKIGGKTDRYGPTAPLLNSFQGKSQYLFLVLKERNLHQCFLKQNAFQDL